MDKHQKRKQKKKQQHKEREKQKRLFLERRQHQEESFKDTQRLGQKLKPFLRRVGCDLPFYDYLDSYEAQFKQISSETKSAISMLLDVHEVSPSMFADTNWKELGYGELRQVFFSVPDEFADYGQSKAQANLCGNVTFFSDSEGRGRAVILLPNRLPHTSDVREQQYALKVPGLLHEIGHVKDAEQSLNIRLETKDFDVVSAEVFAHVYALDRLASLAMRQSYLMLYEALEALTDDDGYEGEVGRRVMDEHAKVEVPDWQDFSDATRQMAGIA